MDATKYKKVVEKKRIYKFLLGLNKNLDEVRGQILAIGPLPSIQEVAAELRCKESRKKVILGTGNQFNTNNASTLVSRKVDDSSIKKGRSGCEHWKKPGHT